MKKWLSLFALVLVIMLASCATTTKMEITTPTPGGSVIAPGRHFKIAGELQGTVPEDAILHVSLLDKDGKEVRYTEIQGKGTDRVSLDWYQGPVFEIVPGTTLEEVAFTAPELVVKESSDPLDATNKALFTDDSFTALITCATDVPSGLADVDFYGLKGPNGEVYQALEEGDYTIVATLCNAKGKVLSKSEKAITIGRRHGTVIHEVTNEDVIVRGGMGMLMAWAGANDFVVLNDLLPGMFGPFYQLTTIAMSYAAETAEYLGGPIETVLYGNAEISTSNSLEIAQYLQRQHQVDSDNVRYYAFSLGEPSIQGEMGEIIEVKEAITLLRIDQVKDGTENGHYLTSEEDVLASDTNASDGWTVAADNDFALMGVMKPYQLKDEEIIDMDIYSYCLYLNNIASMDYQLQDVTAGGKEVGNGNKATGIFRNAADMPSVYEFYLVFDKSLVEKDHTYSLTLQAKDRMDQEISGMKTEVTFIAL